MIWRGRKVETCNAGMLHWFTSPYVHTLKFDQETGQIDTKRLTLLAQPVYNSFNVADVRFADTMRPQTTFAVDGA